MNLLFIAAKTLKIGCLFIFITLVLGCSFNIYAQNKSKTVLSKDLNNNGIPEKIIQIEYTKPTEFPLSIDSAENIIKNGKYIKYVLYRDGQKKGLTIFDYLIGDEESVYWQYKIEKAIDLNNDGLKDLIFYAGDDTTQEYVFLIQKPDYFKAVYSGTTALDMDFLFDFDKSNNIIRSFDNTPSEPILAFWNPRREIFEGQQISWINGDCMMYEKPDLKSEVILRLSEGDVIFNAESTEKLPDNWQIIQTSWGKGWIDKKFLSNTSPTKIFPEK